VSVLPATELVDVPTAGRTFTAARTVRLGDVDDEAQLRLDAIARYLQDVATDDALDAGITNPMGWLVRRTLIRVDGVARLNERVELTTFCAGSGRSWAERRTQIRVGGDVCAEAACLWVQVDMESGRPMRLDDEFDRRYGTAAAGRVVSSRLSLPKAPSADAVAEPWRFRATDVDPFGHVNNAAQWAVVEERLAETRQARRGVGEFEYLAPVDTSDALDRMTDADSGWLVADGAVRSVWRWRA
jgi:acyl-ACP thioesterase